MTKLVGLLFQAGRVAAHGPGVLTGLRGGHRLQQHKLLHVRLSCVVAGGGKCPQQQPHSTGPGPRQLCQPPAFKRTDFTPEPDRFRDKCLGSQSSPSHCPAVGAGISLGVTLHLVREPGSSLSLSLSSHRVTLTQGKEVCVDPSKISLATCQGKQEKPRKDTQAAQLRQKQLDKNSV